MYFCLLEFACKLTPFNPLSTHLSCFINEVNYALEISCSHSCFKMCILILTLIVYFRSWIHNQLRWC